MKTIKKPLSDYTNPETKQVDYEKILFKKLLIHSISGFSEIELVDYYKDDSTFLFKKVDGEWIKASSIEIIAVFEKEVSNEEKEKENTLEYLRQVYEKALEEQKKNKPLYPWKERPWDKYPKYPKYPEYPEYPEYPTRPSTIPWDYPTYPSFPDTYCSKDSQTNQFFFRDECSFCGNLECSSSHSGIQGNISL